MTENPLNCSACGAGLGPRDVSCPYCGRKTGIIPDELANDGFSAGPVEPVVEVLPAAEASSQAEEIREAIANSPATEWLRNGQGQALLGKARKFLVIGLISIVFLCISCVTVIVMLTSGN